MCQVEKTHEYDAPRDGIARFLTSGEQLQVQDEDGCLGYELGDAQQQVL